MDMDIQQIIDIVREAGTLMDRTGGFEVHDKGRGRISSRRRTWRCSIS